MRQSLPWLGRIEAKSRGTEKKEWVDTIKYKLINRNSDV